MDLTPSQYQKMTEKRSKNSPLLKNIVFAFLIGGAICAIGEGFANLYGYLGADRGFAHRA
jgi:stage V sporulation protein AC